MDIYTDFSKNYHFDPIRHFDFESIKNTRDDIALHVGNATVHPHSKDKTNVFIDFEQPNTWYGGPTDPPWTWATTREKEFDKIFTINKSVVEKRNKFLGEEKYGYCFFPYAPKYAPTNFDKSSNIFFSGHWYQDTYSLHREVMVPAIKRYKELCPSNAEIALIAEELGCAELTFQQKLESNASARVSLAYNHQEVSPRFLGTLPLLKNHAEFKKDKMGFWCTNQHKARVIEGFISKTLVLIYKDPFNYVEDFYTLDEHFLYYEDADDLLEKMIHVIDNYDSPEIQKVVNEGYEFAIRNRTVTDFYNTYLKDL